MSAVDYTKAPALPKWVWDLLLHLERQEDEHPTLYVRDRADNYIQSPWCPAESLALVPDAVRIGSLSIARYLDLASQDKEPGA